MNNIIDITKDNQSKIKTPLEKVGMTDIHLPIKKDYRNYIAKIAFHVSLDNSESKGIHMSRLYKILQIKLSEQELTEELTKEILEDAIKSQEKLSLSAYIKINFDYLYQKKALLSDNNGWQICPFEICASLDQNHQFKLDYNIKFYYSSTCPCSAALSRQVIKENFINQHQNKETFTKEEISQWLELSSSIIATPHSQKSYALISFTKKGSVDILDLINQLEDIIKTGVQTAVKRQDEQQFAILNGQNLMFCEDACRIFKEALAKHPSIEDFHIKVKHMESLHQHNATAETVKDKQSHYYSSFKRNKKDKLL